MSPEARFSTAVTKSHRDGHPSVALKIKSTSLTASFTWSHTTLRCLVKFCVDPIPHHNKTHVNEK